MTWQPAAMMHADIEVWAVDYMQDALDARSEDYAQDVKVSNAVQDPRTARMVTFRRDGGLPQSLFDVPRVNVGVWAETDEDVIDLTRLVAALLWAAPDGNPVLHAEMVGGSVAIPDAQPRRSMTFEFRTRGVTLGPPEPEES